VPAFGGHALALVGLQLPRDFGIGVERPSGFLKLAGVQLLKRPYILSADLRGELGRLLIALDQRALDFLVTGQGNLR
jgi:hypothetical protein